MLIYFLNGKEHETFSCENQLSFNFLWKLDLLELIEGAGSEGVGANEARLPSFLLVVVSHFGAGRRLTRTLQTDEHDHIWTTLNKKDGGKWGKTC